MKHIEPTLHPYTVLLARPGAMTDDNPCDTYLCFIHAASPSAAYSAAAIEASATDDNGSSPDEYLKIAIFDGYHPDVSL